MSDDQARANTDRELWVEPIPPTGMSPARLFLTQTGGVGMNVGGHCIVRPIRAWHQLTHPPAEVAYDRVLGWLKAQRLLDEGITERECCWDRAIEEVGAMAGDGET